MIRKANGMEAGAIGAMAAIEEVARAAANEVGVLIKPNESFI